MKVNILGLGLGFRGRALGLKGHGLGLGGCDLLTSLVDSSALSVWVAYVDLPMAVDMKVLSVVVVSV